MECRFCCATLLLLALLVGCGTTPSTAPGAPAPKVSLAAEQRRLADLFRGTPVVFQMQSDGSLRVEVPLRYSFDTGGSTVKPGLQPGSERVDDRTALRRAIPKILGQDGVVVLVQRGRQFGSVMLELW